MAPEFVTKNDLESFRIALLNDLKKILDEKKIVGKKWLRAPEVQQLLKISYSKLQQLRVSGKLSFTRFGATIYYNYEEIQKILADNKINGFK